MIRKLSLVLVGAVGLLLMAAGVVVILLRTSVNGFSAKAAPTAVEAFVAGSARALAMPEAARNKTNPIPNSPEALAEAKEHWADHCAGCHANDGSANGTMGKQMYPPAPDMRQAKTQNLTDGELFYIIENGIRLTGMPGWGNGTEKSTEASWKLVHFIRHLPRLTEGEISEMEKMNPKTPADLEEEKQEAEFLNGGTPDAAAKSHHH